MKENYINELKTIREFFEPSSSCLSEENATFSPGEGTLTVAQQVAHTAQSIDWFIEGMLSEEGFDMDFECHWKDVLPITSLDAARKWFSEAVDRAISSLETMTEEELSSPLPEGAVMGGQPKYTVISGIADHTAHHRGALTVYARLLGKVSQMPYMEM